MLKRAFKGFPPHLHLAGQQVEGQVGIDRHSPQPAGKLAENQPRRDRAGEHRGFGGAGSIAADGYALGGAAVRVIACG